MGFFNHIDIDSLIAEKDIPGLEKCLSTGDITEQFEAAEALIKFNNWKGFAFLVIELQNYQTIHSCRCSRSIRQHQR